MSSQTSTYLPGDIVAEANLATVDIRLQAAPGGYTLITFKAGSAEQVYDWCGQFTNLTVALAEASRTLAAFEQHMSERGIERRRAELIARRDDLARLRGTAPRIAAIDTELAELEDLHTRAALPAFAATVTRRLAA